MSNLSFNELSNNNNNNNHNNNDEGKSEIEKNLQKKSISQKELEKKLRLDWLQNNLDNHSFKLNLPPEIALFGVGTERQRFYVPSNQNFFEGFPVPVLLFDTGCNTILLTLNQGDVKKLFAQFPKDNFNWSITMGKGLVSFATPSLTIKKPNSLMSCQIGGNLFPQKISIPYLRFHLCPEDAAELIQLNPFSKTSYVDDLRDWCVEVSKIHEITKGRVEIAARRQYALLGQFILLDPELSFHQYTKFGTVRTPGAEHGGSICVVYRSPNEKNIENDVIAIPPSVILQLLKFQSQFMRSETGKFLEDLEDEDHDGDGEPYAREYFWDE